MTHKEIGLVVANACINASEQATSKIKEQYGTMVSADFMMMQSYVHEFVAEAIAETISQTLEYLQK